MKRKTILTSLLCLVPAAYAQAYTPEYDNTVQLTLLTTDLSSNSDIGLADIGLLSSAWLERGYDLVNPCNSIDKFTSDMKRRYI